MTVCKSVSDGIVKRLYGSVCQTSALRNLSFTQLGFFLQLCTIVVDKLTTMYVRFLQESAKNCQYRFFHALPNAVYLSHVPS